MNALAFLTYLRVLCLLYNDSPIGLVVLKKYLYNPNHYVFLSSSGARWYDDLIISVFFCVCLVLIF